MSGSHRTLIICGTAFIVGTAILSQISLPDKQAAAPVAKVPATKVQTGDTPPTFAANDILADALDTTSLSGHYLAGRTASLNSDHARAAYYLEKVVKGDSKDGHYVAGLAIRHYLVSGEVDKAVNLVKEVKHVQRLRPLELVLVVNALKQGDVEQAHQRVKDMELVGVYQLLSPLLEGWADYSDSGSSHSVKKVHGFEHHTYDMVQKHHRALQHELSGDIKKARKLYENIAEDMDSMPDSLGVAAIQFFIRHDYTEQAKALLVTLQAKHSRDAFWQLGIAEDYLTQWEETPLLTVESVTDGFAQSLADIGLLLTEEGLQDDGIIMLQLSRYLRPDTPLVTMALAEALERSGDYQQAIALYSDVQASSMLRTLATLYQARTYQAADDTAKARELLDELHANGKPASYYLYVMMADIERVEKRYRKAASYHTQAIDMLGTLTAKDWPILYHRAIMYDLDKQWKKAEKDLKAALELAPQEPQLLNHLGYSWLVRGEHLDEALAMLEEALQANPDDAQIIDSYGWALFKTGKYDKSLGILEKALSIIPADPTVNEHYADALWKNGRKLEATYHWERALLFEPTEDGAKEAIMHKLRYGMDIPVGRETHHSDVR